MKSVVAFSALALLASIAVAKPLSKDAALKVMHERHEGDGSDRQDQQGPPARVDRRRAEYGRKCAVAAKGMANLAGKSSRWFRRRHRSGC